MSAMRLMLAVLHTGDDASFRGQYVPLKERKVCAGRVPSRFVPISELLAVA